MQGSVRSIAALAFGLAVLASGARGQALPTPRTEDAQAIAACLDKAGNLEGACIGIIADACLKTADSTQRMGDCETRELSVWDGWLNRDYLRVMTSLRPVHRARLRSIERAFVADRDGRCNFIEQVNGPTTMNGPFIQDCALHATAEQWLWLRAYLPGGAQPAAAGAR